MRTLSITDAIARALPVLAAVLTALAPAAAEPPPGTAPIPPAPKTYMGRTIATTMHYTGAPWLVRGSRAREEGTALLLEKLAVIPGTTLCDLGCGNGFYTIPMARRTGAAGRVYAVDIQNEMLTLLDAAAKDAGVTNILPTLGTLVDPKLPAASIDLMLLVDVYHEMSHPEHMLRAIRASLRPTGRLVLVEFRGEDPEVPIKPLHKMTKKQIVKELTANGFVLAADFDGLPWQHMMTFVLDPAFERGIDDRAPAAGKGRTSATWRRFVEQRQAGGPTTLPDYGFAGLALHAEPPEAIDPAVFDVDGFGARADDGRCDRAALEQAIAAAAANGGGIVRFGPGRYRLSETEDEPASIVIRGDDIVLQGAGSGAGGTELFMRHPLRPADASKPWSTPALLRFAHGNAAPRDAHLATIVAPAARETFSIEVDDASRIGIGDFVALRMQDPAATGDLLAGLEPWSIWTRTIEHGIRVHGERHRVVDVREDTVTFGEPIHIDIDPAYSWRVTACPMASGWAVRDLAIRGDAPEPFVHHQDARHDSGWSALQFEGGRGPSVRRCRFIDVSWAVAFDACYGATAINCSIEGRRGHGSISSGGFSYGTLIAFCADVSRGGAFHGFGVSHGAVGTVIHRCVSSDRGLDWHASGPYATLVDASRGGLIGNGGAFENLPNHLQFLTLWNFEQTAGTTFAQLDWWQPRRGDERYGMAKVVRPIIVGFHGLPTTFLPSSCLVLESHGEPVEPFSLFEAQLELRLGGVPAWMLEGRRRLARFEATGRW